MEEIEQQQRRRSGLYDGHNFSSTTIESNAPLQVFVSPLAGSRFHEGHESSLTKVAPSDASHLPVVDRAWQSAPAAPVVPFYKKRWFIISQIVLVPVSIALIFILLFPVVRAIVQLVVNRARLNIEVATITVPANDSFNLHMSGFVSHTGIFKATIHFDEPIQVSWVENSTAVTPLGEMTMDDLHASSKRATLDHASIFTITDPIAFGRFSKTMITGQNFTWHLQSQSVRVQALKFPVAKGIKFNQDVTLNGFQSFSGGVVLKDFTLPSDNPAGGINFVAVTELVNTSPFSLNLGTVIFDLSYKNLSLGLGSSPNTVITNGTNEITLSGTLKPQISTSDLAIISELFTNYLNGESSPVIATGQSTLQSDNSTISWLSEGLQSLQLNVPFKAFTPINPIRSISIGDFALQFSAADPWAPMAESNSVQARLQLPFGFHVDIDQIQNSFNITQGGNVVAGLSTPLGASKSSISVLSAVDTSGTIDITIQDTSLDCPSPLHPTFSSFNAELTDSSMAIFNLEGHSRAVAQTGVGSITLDPIKFNVTSNLKGLQGLKGMTTIGNVDVTGGTTQGIELSIDVSIYNPSNLHLAVGDLTLQLLRDSSVLGTALLPNLTLEMGNNTIKATSLFEANNSPAGSQTLNDFVGKKDAQLTISGYDGSTQIASLTEAFKSLNLDVTLPALQSNLLSRASLEILPTTGHSDNISHVTVDLVNPFSAELVITQIKSMVTSFGVELGNINTATEFRAAPKATTTSPTLDLNMNFDPVALFSVTRALAGSAGLNTAAFDAIVQLGGIQYLPFVQASGNQARQASLFEGFDLTTFVRSAFQKLESDVQLTSTVSIGDYQTTFQFTQTGVPVSTDQTLDLILPILAHPIVQQIVGGSTLGIDTVLITDPQQESFGTILTGNIANAGPFDAVISFPSGLTVEWAGKPLGNIKMNDIQVVADVGAKFTATSSFVVADVAHLTDFTKALLTEEEFEWMISGDNLTVTALGIQVPGISLSSKSVTLKGFNGLKDGVQIQSFDLPSDDPAGGIHLTLQATTVNPSQVGVQLDSLGFDTLVGGTLIASVLTDGGVTLAPASSSNLSLSGRLLPQTTSAGLNVVSEIFNNFVHGQDSDVLVQGASAGPSSVTWLNDAIKLLRVAATLPNRGPLTLIQSIELNDLSVKIQSQDEVYAPPASSKATIAQYKNPFGFALQVIEAGQELTLSSQGVDIAQLELPKAPADGAVSTGNAADLNISFTDQPLKSLNDAAFQAMFTQVTLQNHIDLSLRGVANVTAKTAVGNIDLSNIAFNVPSSLKGINAFGGTALLSNVTVTGSGGGSQYIVSPLTTTLQNPSSVSLETTNILLTV
ncbi:hypothetical protein BDN72DRAFT_885777, partial [Pluteus cervinus]